MTKKFTLLFALILALTGCSLYHIDSADTSNEYYPPKDSIDEVAHLESVNRPHEVIGHITVNTERRQSGQEVIGKLKKEAAELGGDAIINLRTDATGAWKKIPWQKFLKNAYIRANFKADVVVFK